VNLNPSSIIFTDDWQAYKRLRGEFVDHPIINHSDGIYVRGDTYRNRSRVRSGTLKTGMRGAYKHVSERYLQSHLDEYAWRHNAKRAGTALFSQLVAGPHCRMLRVRSAAAIGLLLALLAGCGSAGTQHKNAAAIKTKLRELQREFEAPGPKPGPDTLGTIRLVYSAPPKGVSESEWRAAIRKDRALQDAIRRAK
jgi:hypothetical protein